MSPTDRLDDLNWLSALCQHGSSSNWLLLSDLSFSTVYLSETLGVSWGSLFRTFRVWLVPACGIVR